MCVFARRRRDAGENVFLARLFHSVKVCAKQGHLSALAIQISLNEGEGGRERAQEKVDKEEGGGGGGGERRRKRRERRRKKGKDANTVAIYTRIIPHKLLTSREEDAAEYYVEKRELY